MGTGADRVRVAVRRAARLTPALEGALGALPAARPAGEGAAEVCVYAARSAAELRELSRDSAGGSGAVVLLCEEAAAEWGAAVGLWVTAAEAADGLLGRLVPALARQAEGPAVPGERSYRQLMELAADGIAVLDAEGRVLEANSALCRLLGFSGGEVVGLDAAGFFPADEMARQPLRFAELRTGVSVRQEREARHRDGRRIPVEINSSMLPDGRFQAIIRDVGERRRAEAALRASEAQYRLLFETAAQGVIHQDAAGWIVSVNPAAERILGRSAAELRECSSADVQWRALREDGTAFPAAEHPATRALHTRREVSGVTMGIFNPREGRHRWIEIHAVPQFQPGEAEPFQVFTAFHDVTERKDAAALLQARERRFRSLIENASDVITVLFTDGRIGYASPAVERVLGFEPGELAGVDAFPLIDARDRDRVREEFTRCLAEPGLQVQVEFRITHRDGSLRVMEARATNLLADAAVAGVVVNSRDVTERAEAAERIRFQAQLLDTVGEAVVATDARGTILYWNRFAEHLYGWPAQEAVGRSILELTPTAQSRQQGKEIMARLRAGERWSGEFEVQRRDGSRFHALVTDAPIHDAEGRMVGVVGVSADLTQRRELEQQLRQSQKMEAVGRLAGGIAHDFNNLLHVINGTVQILLWELPDPELLRADLEEIRVAGERAAALTQQLLAFSRRQPTVPESVELGEQLERLTRTLRRLLTENIELETHLDSELGPVQVDPGQLDQIVLNLSVNARDAMPGGGRLELRAERVRQTAAELRRRGLGEGMRECARLSVRDSGCGMNAEVRARVFEPFFTTKPAGKGTGLGLSVVHGIVQQNGGWIEVESEPGEGSSFSIFLPLAEAGAAEPTGAGPAAETAPAGQGETVLVVEDEAAVRGVICRALERGGYRVLTAAHGAEALTLAEACEGELDLVVTDVVMPVMGGRELVERLRARFPEVRAILVSGYPGDEDLPEDLPDGGSALLQKPFPADLLLKRAREVLDGAAGPAR